MVKVQIIKRKGRKYYEAEFIDPRTERFHRRSLKTPNRREAERLAGKLQKELEDGEFSATRKLKWQDFRQRYEAEAVLGLTVASVKDIKSTLDLFESTVDPPHLQTIDESLLQRFQMLISAGRSKRTVGKHLRNLKRMLRWAVRHSLLQRCPHIEMPKGISRGKAKGRALAAEEFERMLAAADKVVNADQVEVFKRLLNGLWLSGLRLGESLKLSWSDPSTIMVDLDGEYPMFRIPEDADKSRRERLLPIAPDFSVFLQETPQADRRGLVFPIDAPLYAVSALIAAIGKKAGVKVDSKSTATAHDLRRSFGYRWAGRVRVHILQQLMRHSAITTTMSYYVQAEANETAAAVWAAQESTTNSLPLSDDESAAHEKTPAKTGV